MRPMKDWLTASSVPSSEPWTRTDLKTLMIYRDPLGNVIELFCYKGFEGSEDLQRGANCGHETTIDIDTLRDDTLKRPVT